MLHHKFGLQVSQPPQARRLRVLTTVEKGAADCPDHLRHRHQWRDTGSAPAAGGVELEGVLVQADALHANRLFPSTSPSAAPTS